MRFRVEVVCLHDGGEQRCSVVEMERAELALETLGMSVAEGKAMLHGVQDFMATQQVIEDLKHKRVCSACGQRYPSKEAGTHTVKTALVQKRIASAMMGRMPQFVPVEELFSGRHFDQEIIVLCVRWYLNFKLSYRDLVAMMGERGIGLAHTTILRWVQHYTPEFAKRWQRYARPVGGSWRCDETYIKVKGIWVYLYRAVDKAGKTVDFYLSRKRDVAAAKAFLRKAMRRQRIPTKITLDAYAASHRAVADLKAS